MSGEKVRKGFVGYEVKEERLVEVLKEENEDGEKVWGMSKGGGSVVKYEGS